MLVFGPEDLVVMRWNYNSGEITVVYELIQNTPKIWLCSATILTGEDDGSRCSRRVDDVKVKKELMGCQIWALVVSSAWVATMSPAFDGWRRLVASMVVDWGLRHRGH